MKEKFVLAFLALIFSLSVFALEDKCETPLSSSELADHWVACEGVAKTKDAAIDKAIKRGISMVYGQTMSAEDKMESHSSETNVSTPLGSASVEVSSESVDSAMATKTAGFVREYKVISTVPEDGGLIKAHVHARIINPRSGIDAVILVTKPEVSIALRTELIKVGPKKSFSGHEIGDVAEDALCGALAGSRHFRVCTTKDIKAAVANNNLTSALVGAGMVPSSELLQAGQMLTCDYILSTKLEKVSYTSKLGLDKTTKKMGKMQSMKVTLSLQLTNVRTGTSAAKDTVTLSLGNEEIKSMLESDEDADLLRGVLNCIVQPLRGWIKKNAK